MRIQSMCLCLIILCFLKPAFAQDSAPQTFTSKDGTFGFEYPVGWSVESIASAWGEDDHLSVANYVGYEHVLDPESIMLQMTFPTKFVEIGVTSAQTPRGMVEQTLAEAAIAMPLLSIFGEGPVIRINPTFQAAMSPTVPPPTATPNPSLSVSPITDFTVNGRSAAYGYAVAQMPGVDASQLIVVVDLGEGYWVQFSAASIQGGLAVIQQNEAAILQIAQSLRFTPLPPAASGNPDLPRLYSGPVGIWNRGNVEFAYPDDWYVPNMFAFSNMSGNLLNVSPVSGQFIASLNGVSETRSIVDKSEVSNSCNVPNSTWTARTLVAQIMSQMFPSQLETLTKAGISITQPEFVVINGLEIVYFRQFQQDIEVLAMYVDLGGGDVMSLSAIAVRGEMAQFEDQLFQVAGTLRYTPNIPDSCLNPEAQIPSTP